MRTTTLLLLVATSACTSSNNEGIEPLTSESALTPREAITCSVESAGRPPERRDVLANLAGTKTIDLTMAEAVLDEQVRVTYVSSTRTLQIAVVDVRQATSVEAHGTETVTLRRGAATPNQPGALTVACSLHPCDSKATSCEDD